MLPQEDRFERVLTLFLFDPSVEALASAPFDEVRSSVNTGGRNDPSFTRRNVNLHSLSKPCAATSLSMVTLSECVCNRCRTFLSFVGGLTSPKKGRRSWHSRALSSSVSLIIFESKLQAIKVPLFNHGKAVQINTRGHVGHITPIRAWTRTS